MADLIVCGGGTGGHFFSGLALAEYFLKLHPQAKVIFVGTKNGIEARHQLDDPRMSVKFISAKGVKGKGPFAKLTAIFFLLWGFLESFALLLQHRPKIIFGVGGYASVPTVSAAIFLSIFFRWKVGILEQNSSAGLANRVFSKFLCRSYAAFPCPGFKLVDLPLRKETLNLASSNESGSWPPKTIFILGGSQGASGLNSKVVSFLPEIKKLFPEVRFIHQTGRRDFEMVQKAYQKFELVADVFEFSNEMPKYYSKADLLICRSGAMTVFEVMAFRRPAVFVPFPAAADDHQTKNAQSVQKQEWVISEKDFSWERVKPILEAQTPAIPKRNSAETISWHEILS